MAGTAQGTRGLGRVIVIVIPLKCIDDGIEVELEMIKGIEDWEGVF